MGLAGNFAAGVNAIGALDQNRLFHDQLQTYPQLLQAQLQLAQAQGGIAGAQAQYAPQMAQANAQQAQNVAGLTGVQLQYAPQMAQAMLTNKNLINQWYPQITQADIASKNAYTQNAPFQASAMLSGDPVAQMLYDSKRIVPILTSSDGGMTVHPVSQGPLINAGGGGIANNPNVSATDYANSMPVLPLTSNQQQQVAQNVQNALPATNSQPTAQPSGLAAYPAMPMIQTGIPALDQMYQTRMNNVVAQMSKDPRFGNAKGGAGGTYNTPDGPVSTDTNANTTADQKTIASLQRVKPLLNTLSDNLAQFQTLGGQAKLHAAQFGNYVLGQNNQLPNQYAEAMSALETAPEGLLKGWGLNVTDDSLKSMRKAVEPVFGESPAGYQARIVNTLQQLKENQEQAADRLSSGTNLNAVKQPEQPQYSDEDIQFTAKKYGMSPDQVKKKLGIS